MEPSPRSAPAPSAQGGPRLSPATWVILAGTAVRLVLSAVVPLGNDEAYYVDWARNLEPGYLDHPPAVAWLMALPLRTLGAHPYAVRLPAVLLHLATLWLAASLVRARAGERAALAAALGLQAAPAFAVGASLIAPDAPLAFSWVGTLWALDRALRLDPRLAVLAGAFLGLGALSKLHAGLLALAILAALLASPEGRRLLRKPWPWLGVLLALALASPMLLWNAAHGWPTLTFQASHGLGGRSFSAIRLLGSMGGQLLYFSPVLVLLAAAASFAALRRRQDALCAALAFSALPVVAFFTLSAALTPGALPHWAAPGWLSAVITLCLSVPPASRWFRRALFVGYGETAVLLLGLLLLLSLPLPAAFSAFGRTAPVSPGPLDDLVGWREGAAAARAVAGEARLAAPHWIILGQLGWYDGRSPAYVGERVTAPSLYDPDPLAAKRPLLVVTVDRLGPQLDSLERRLGPLEPAGTFQARQGDRLVRTYRFWWWRPRG
ncbi:MAG TPA: glycosyltransferase family 39 protein [Anaeromyxobacter sp.]|nr:glycosyltransferase family 39 protein [Anaeromyxobacter sp.]